MSVPLHVLILEDHPADAELMLHELRRAGFDCTWQRVETEADYLARLDAGLEVILADYSLPQFNALRALQLLQERRLDIPFIVITGSIGKEKAVECMRQGAADYLLKDRPARLGPAVRRALYEKRLRAEKRQAEEALRESEERYRTIVENSHELISEVDGEARYLYVNPNYGEVLGCAPEELIGRSAFEQIHPDDLAAVLAEFGKPSAQLIFRIRHKDGEWRWLESTGKAYFTVTREFRGVIMSRDITHRQRVEEALRQAEAKYRGIFENAVEGIFQTTADGRLLTANPALARMLGYESSEELLAALPDVTQAWAAPERSEFIRLLEEHGLVQGLEAQFYRRDGSLLWASVNARAVRDANGALLYYEGIVEDITARKQAEEARREEVEVAAALALENARLLEQAQSANRFKSDFLITLSHELRTPLNIVLGYTELLLEETFGPLPPQQIDSLQRVRKAAYDELNLITAILEVSRLEAEQAAVEREEVEVAALLAELQPAVAESVRAKPGLELAWYVAPGLPRLWTDRTKLKRVLRNLLDNALKFTETGRVTVSAAADNDGVEIRVADTGSGIEPEVLPMIFEMFQQGDSSTTRRHGGVGLGLYIVKQLLELLGGTVTVESEMGKGSTFRVWVPLNQSSRH